MGRSWTFPPSGRRTKVDHILRDQNFIFHCRRPGQDASRFVIPWFAVDGKKSPYNPETSQKFSSENHDPYIATLNLGEITLFLLDIPAWSFTQSLGCFGRISWGGPNSCALKVVHKYPNDPKYLKYPKYPIPNHPNQSDLPRNSRRFDFSCSTFQFLNIQWLD